MEVKVLNEPREGKRLLVVDIDYTIYDLGSSAETPMELARCSPLARSLASTDIVSQVCSSFCVRELLLWSADAIAS